MTSARTPLPTDLVALVSFDGRVYPNEAKPFERLGADQRARPLEEAIEQWFSFATGKHTWVSVRGATIRGLISARKRGNRSAWEVDVLIDASGDDDDVALSLFSRMQSGIIRLGAERVFLRLDSESELTEVARTAGFFKFGSETLYRLDAKDSRISGESDLPLRMKTKTDTMEIYQLYNRTVPANVRAIEGNTLREWQAAQERWGGRCTDMLVDHGVVEGWLRVCPGNIGRIYALDQRARYDKLVSTGLNVLQDRDVFCLVPDYNVELASALERLAFEPIAQYDVLAKRLTRMVGELQPEKATKALPVG